MFNAASRQSVYLTTHNNFWRIILDSIAIIELYRDSFVNLSPDPLVNLFFFLAVELKCHVLTKLMKKFLDRGRRSLTTRRSRVNVVTVRDFPLYMG